MVDGVDDLVRSGRLNCREDVRRLTEKGGGSVNGDEMSGSGQDGDEYALIRAWCSCGNRSVAGENVIPSDWSRYWMEDGLLTCSQFGLVGGVGGSASDSMKGYVLLRGLYDLDFVAREGKKSSGPCSLPSRSTLSSCESVSLLVELEAVEG